MAEILYISVLIWLVLGSSGFIYWWTSQHDLTIYQLPLILGTALMGPFSWLFGYFIHGKSPVIVKKRLK